MPQSAGAPHRHVRQQLARLPGAFVPAHARLHGAAHPLHQCAAGEGGPPEALARTMALFYRTLRAMDDRRAAEEK